MGYHTGNVYYSVVINALVLVKLIRIQIKMQKTLAQQYVFMFTAMYHIVLLISYEYMNNKKYVQCFPLVLVM